MLETSLQEGFAQTIGDSNTILMPHELPKAYDPAAIEDHWAEYWVREKLFAQPTPSETETAQRREANSRPGRPSGLYYPAAAAQCDR